MKRLLKRNIKKTVPILRVSEIDKEESYLFLDTREFKEFKISHIKSAKCVGYDAFDLEKTRERFPDKSKKIIVYCSIGIRSEIIGEKLIKAGYKNVFNLYGGIFEWKNQYNPVMNANEKPTEKVHTFSKEWSR